MASKTHLFTCVKERLPEYDDLEDRQDRIQKAELIKIASAVAVLVQALFFLACPCLSNLLSFAFVALVGFEFGRMADNYQKIIENPIAQWWTNWTERRFFDYLTDKTLVARSLWKLSYPL